MSYQQELNLKAWGLEASAAAHESELRRAQDMAFKLAALMGEVTIDDVREAIPNLVPGNYLGSVFKGPHWICTGFNQARHKGSHARIVRKWKLRD